jgi:hypothetical protein
VRRPALLVFVALVAATIAAAAGLAVWLSIHLAPASAGPDIVSVWRGGVLVTRRIGPAVADPKVAYAADLAPMGTTVVVERILGEGRVTVLAKRLFGSSFVAGRDGVRATLDGKDAFLTPHDLTVAHLYRGMAPDRWLGLVEGIDTDGVLDRLARELGCSKDALWSGARFRRFIVARTLLANLPEEPNPVVAARRDTSPTAARLTVALEDATRVVADRVDSKGRFMDLTVGGRYDWRLHAEATLFLAQAGAHFESHTFRSVARRAAWLTEAEIKQHCGLETCMGTENQIETSLSARLLLAYAWLAQERTGASLRDPTRQLAAFLRAQQRPDGGFYASYDRGRQAPNHDGRPEVDAEAVLALAHAHLITKDQADLDAAERGLDHLIGRPGLLGVRDYLNADFRICEAVQDLWQRDQNQAGLAFCERWAEWGALLQLDGTAAEYAGGYRRGVGSMPDIVATANRTEGLLATIATAMRAGRSSDSLRALDLRATSGLELLLRQQLPGQYDYTQKDPGAALGAFAANPVDLTPRMDVTAAAGSAIFRCLKVLETRGLPTPKKARREANRIIE